MIAELKRASPSRGVIRDALRPAGDRAIGYAAAGAPALSVLTDERFFGGTLDHLARGARGGRRCRACGRTSSSIPYQVEEARAYGADAVLVIAAAVTAALGRSSSRRRATAGLDVLVEVHDEPSSTGRSRPARRCIGVNNRDLSTFARALETAERLAPLVPPDAARRRERLALRGRRARAWCAAGAQAVLVGEAFMESPDPGAALAEWLR